LGAFQLYAKGNDAFVCHSCHGSSHVMSSAAAGPTISAAKVSHGHHVAASVVRRRFRLGWTNFEQVYRPLVDHWLLYDNSGPIPILLARGEKS
jgi:predicted ABC-type ATPase